MSNVVITVASVEEKIAELTEQRKTVEMQAMANINYIEGQIALMKSLLAEKVVVDSVEPETESA